MPRIDFFGGDGVDIGIECPHRLHRDTLHADFLDPCDLLQLTVRDRAERGTTRAPSSSVPTSGSASQTFEDISARRSRSKRVHTIATEEIDAGIMPASYARDLLASNQAKLVGWYSELDEIQFGVLFASSKMIAIRQSRNSYVRTDAGSPTTRRRCCARTGIPSVPQTPSRTKRRQPLPGMFILIVEPAPRLQSRQAPIIDPQAQLDVADIDRQIAWHKAQGRSTRPSAHAMSLIEFRQVGIFPQRRISLASLPMS